MPLFLMQPTTENYEITHERKFWTHEIPTRKNLGPTKYPKEKIWDSPNTHGKKFRPTKYPRRHDYTMTLEPRDPR